jgi:pimeloyl-ACP methyl ester carboxylesterase
MKIFIPMTTFKKISIGMLQILTALLIIALTALFVILLINSPGDPGYFKDEKGNVLAASISEKTFVTIGGVRQGMFIRGKNLKNPVLLYVHGGPAFPNYFLIDKYAPGLEDYFTVCYWEQRGGGLSFSSDVTAGSMNFEQLSNDAIEVTRYLCKRFGKEKIYMLAHSGGTPFAIMAAAKAPELYYAYMGMAQITRQAESEKMAYAYMKDQYTVSGNKKTLSELNRYSVMDTDSGIIAFYTSMIRDKYMHELGIGTMRNMHSVFTGVFIPVWMCRAYTLKEKINIWKAKFSFVNKTRLIQELFSTDVTARVPELKIPVYFFSGKYDLTVNKDLSRRYLDSLKAPLKGFYCFDKSAHSPLFEEPQKFMEIIAKDVLAVKNDLAEVH